MVVADVEKRRFGVESRRFDQGKVIGAVIAFGGDGQFHDGPVSLGFDAERGLDHFQVRRAELAVADIR